MIIPKKLAVSALLIALGATACAQTFGQTAAVVNGHRISVDELNDRVKLVTAQSSGQPAGDVTTQALLALIETELVRETGAARKIVPTAGEIEAKIDQIRAENGVTDDQTFTTQLKAAGYTIDSFREQVRLQLIQDKLQEQLAQPVSDADVRTVYRQEQAQFRQIKVRHILFSTQTQSEAKALAKANDALAQLRGGADFGTVAKKLSDDPGSKDTGGLLSPDWIQLGQLDAQFGAAAFAATVGKVTDPVLTQFGYHLILLVDKRVQPLAEVAPSIRQQLESQAGDRALTDFASKLVGRAKIEVNPRYGDWDEEKGTIVAHEFFKPAAGLSPSPSPTIPVIPLPS